MYEEGMMLRASENSLRSLDDDSARASMSKTLSSQTQQQSVKTCDSHVKIILKRIALFPAGSEVIWSGSEIISFPGQTTVAACVKKFLLALLGSRSECAKGGDHAVIVFDGMEVTSAKDRRLKMVSNHVKLSNMFRDHRSEAQIYVLVRRDDYDKSDLMSQAECMVKQQVSIKNGELLLQEKVGEFKNQFREMKKENRALKEQLRRLQEGKNEMIDLQKENGDIFANYKQRADAAVEDLKWKISCHMQFHWWAAKTIKLYRKACEVSVRETPQPGEEGGEKFAPRPNGGDQNPFSAEGEI